MNEKIRMENSEKDRRKRVMVVWGSIQKCKPSSWNQKSKAGEGAERLQGGGG